MSSNSEATRALDDSGATSTYVEFHDARLASCSVSPDTTTLLFTHVCVYLPIGTERYQIWSYSAELIVGGVNLIEMRGAMTESAWVSDGTVRDPAGAQLRMGISTTRTAISDLVLDFDSGTTLRIAATTCLWRLIQRQEALNIWEGSLGE